MFALQAALLAEAFLVRPAAAERLNEALRYIQEPEGEVLTQARSLVGSADKICGGPEIWTLLTSNPSVSGVQNIKWSKIQAIADGYLKLQEAKIKEATQALDLLTTHIETAKAQAQVQQISEDKVREIVTVAMAPFGGLPEAGRTKCGVPSIRPRAPRGSFNKCKEDFKVDAAKVFDGSVRLGNAPFLDICYELLPCENPLGCYCDNLCQSLRDTAQRLSDESAGEFAGEMDALLRKEMALKEQLESRRAEVSSCQRAKEQLDAFGKQIEVLQGDVNDRHEDVQKAEEALDDAQYELGDVEDALKAEQAEADHALELLKEEHGKFRLAQMALEALNESEASLQTALRNGMESLAAAREEMEAAQSADAAIKSVKELVSVTMLKMQMFFDQAVQEPLRNLGISEDLDLKAVFPEPQTLASVGAMGQAVDSMRGFCDADGQAAMDAVKSKVDLSPLCKMEEAGAIKMSIKEAVSSGMAEVKKRLEEVKGYLNPYRGQSRMNKTVAEGLVAQGEPAFLREIITAYGSSHFYTQYLKLWKFGGPFLKLLKDVEDMNEALMRSKDDIAEKLETIKKEHANVVLARQEAEQNLTAAGNSSDLAAAKRAELLSHVEDLKEMGGRLRKELEEFEAQVEEARRKHQEALDKLGKTHADWVASGMGTLWSADGKEVRMVPETASFLQAWEEASAALEGLRGEVTQARDRMVSDKIQADSAERAYHDALSRLSYAEEGQEFLHSREKIVGVSKHAL